MLATSVPLSYNCSESITVLPASFQIITWRILNSYETLAGSLGLFLASSYEACPPHPASSVSPRLCPSFQCPLCLETQAIDHSSFY